MIGTQALWHDRNKIRGDYGSTFRTGAIVVATLDTNVGTLSFGLWKDNSAASTSSASGSGGGSSGTGAAKPSASSSAMQNMTLTSPGSGSLISSGEL